MLIDNCLNHSVLPAVFNDDLTLYETVCKLVESNNELEKRVADLESKANISSDNN